MKQTMSQFLFRELQRLMKIIYKFDKTKCDTHECYAKSMYTVQVQTNDVKYSAVGTDQKHV